MLWLTQTKFLLLLLLKLKLWRYMFVVVTIACLTSNIFIYSVIDNLISQFSIPHLGLTSYSANSLGSKGGVVADRSGESVKRILEMMRDQGVSKDAWLRDCSGRKDCRKKFFMELHSTLDSELVASVNFNDNQAGSNVSVQCRISEDAELGCPYLVQLAMQATVKPALTFKSVTFHNLIDQSDRSESSGGSSTDGDTICHKAQTDFQTAAIFQITIAIQMLLVSSGIVLHLVLGTLSSISKLKENEFLQLMFHNGLPVSSYWTTVWCVALIESLVFAGVATASYGLQCPGFYQADRLLLAFASIYLFCLYATSFSYLSSVVIKSYFLQILLMLLVNVVIFVIVLMNRFLLNVDRDKFQYRDLTLLVPGGHVAEFLLEVLTSRRELRGYYLAIPILTAVVTLVVISLTVMLDFLLDSGNGLKLPMTFIFSSKFWKTTHPDGDIHSGLHINDAVTQLPNIEPVPDTFKKCVNVSNVYKTYRSRRLPFTTAKVVQAVKGISCSIYDSQITALIGHNGAGKTTLIKMLIGDETPSSGSASIGTCVITDPLDRLRMRGDFGICEQVNVLSSSLTVQQTIRLCLVSKGLRVEDEMDEAKELLRRLDLYDKQSVAATSLSGGQKRKLCTILALLGRPKVVFLDEPTSGLDPVSRRHLWQILQEYKVGRCIILCTQFMDEADILADRKIFLSEGALICAGSSLFLKYAFGCGFVFSVSLKTDKAAAELLRLLRQVCDGLELKSQFRTELELQMAPTLSQSVPAVLRQLESCTDLVDAFGLSQATLDEIFMRLKDVKVDQLTAAFQSGTVASFLEEANKTSQADETTDFQQLLANQTFKATSASSTKQFSALMGMNLRRLRRAPMKLCCRFIFPVILLLALGGSIYLESIVGSFTFPVIRSFNTTGRTYYSGVCIADKDDDSSLNQTYCRSVLGSDSLGKFAVLTKDRDTDLSTFLLNQSTLSQMNSTCSSFGPMDCPFVYASSWQRGVSNTNRSLEIGMYKRFRSRNFSPFKNDLVQVFTNIYTVFISIPNTATNFLFTPINNSFFPLMGTFVVIILLSIIPVTYISDPIEDKDSRVRQQLTSMGMSSVSYWLNTYLLHWVQYAVFVVISTILFVVFLSNTYANAFFVLGMCLPLLLLGTSSNQLMVYAIGSVLKKPNPIITVVYFFIVLFMSLTMLAVQLNNVLSLTLIWCLPPFAAVSTIFFGTKLGAYAMAFYSEETLAKVPDLANIYFNNPFVVQSLMATIVHIVLLAVLLSVLERRSLLALHCKSCLLRRASSNDVGVAGDDLGVEQEMARLAAAKRSRENVLEVRQLEKTYSNGVKAVKGVTFGCVSGEIFGLLGPNGAGKTTTLSVVVGEEVATEGSCEVRFLDSWMSGSDGAINGAIGYCPQHNPLFDSVTVMEHLKFYASIRGVKADAEVEQIENLVRGLHLSQHRNKRASQLSGGNKRRLCLAIALLGNPSVVVIDEASTGVDPEAKRFIWSAIRAMVSNSRSVMVTTHSMEEVEALCSRVAIMSEGSIIAFGTIQQLRSRYGHAYTLDILLDVEQDEEVPSVEAKKSALVMALKNRFNDSRVVVDLSTRLQLLVPQEAINSLSDAMEWLTDCQVRLNVRYFAFYQMSLDQVFVRLIKEHEETKSSVENNSSSLTLV